MLTFNTARQLNYFMTCTTVDDIHYIATSKDELIFKGMYLTQRNYSEYYMELFHELVKHYYQVDDSSGIFLELGANIGTTGIYFLKKLTPNLKLLAFEPDAENFKLLRANLILNDVEEKTVVENYGLGLEESEQIMHRSANNPGSNSLFVEYVGGTDLPSETIKIIPLDKYFAKKNLDVADIKYIWLFTQGFEPQVLFGAKNLLVRNPAPICMEFNPHIWKISDSYEKMLQFLAPIYSNYIWFREVERTGKINVYPLEKLLEFQDETGYLGPIFLIKRS